MIVLGLLARSTMTKRVSMSFKNYALKMEFLTLKHQRMKVQPS